MAKNLGENEEKRGPTFAFNPLLLSKALSETE